VPYAIATTKIKLNLKKKIFVLKPLKFNNFHTEGPNTKEIDTNGKLYAQRSAQTLFYAIWTPNVKVINFTKFIGYFILFFNS